MSAGSLWAPAALSPDGWASDVLLHWDATGTLLAVTAQTPAPTDVERVAGPLLPGMPNLHSHAFQRAMAGLAEFRGNATDGDLKPGASAAARDSFWSWRTVMYRFALALEPAQLRAIALALYVEMLEAGYTAVCEFHYLHHDRDGRAYADDATLAETLIDAAQEAGIGLTLLPVLYQSGGFGGQPAGVGQRRFLRGTDNMLALLTRLRPQLEAIGGRLGLAPHSLRAVPPAALTAALAGLDALDPTAPIHIHIAEQQQEVLDCLAWSGQRPVAWLLDHVAVDGRWCLVHATHLDDAESQRAAATGAVAGLCPTTEANLGDGIFDAGRWLAAGGAWGLGSDSHVCVNAAEELMLLEYSQRYATRQRNLLATATQPEVATAMMLAAVAGGAQASGRPLAGLAAGQRADFVVLDPMHRALAGLDAPQMLAGHVFASSRSSAISEVRVGGRSQVRGGRHRLHDAAMAGLARARRRLLGEAAQ